MSARRGGGEEGWALVTAVIMTALMLSLGLAVFGWVDGQQKQSRSQRNRDSAFNLAEGALTQQLYILSQKWPSNSGATNYSTTCTQATAPPTYPLCPSPTQVNQSYATVDYGQSAWTIQVRDNPSPYGLYWSDSLLTDPSVKSYDVSGPNGVPDNKVWVRAAATAKGRTRAIVALVQVEPLPLKGVPHSPLDVGGVDFGNNGAKKNFVDTTGSVNSYVRDGLNCSSDSRVTTRVAPCNLAPSPSSTALTPDQLEALRQTAKARGTWWQDCSQAPGPGPTNNPPATASAAVYFVETCTSGFSGNATWNSPSRPGIFVVADGSISFTGNPNFYGVIYDANASGSSTTRVSLSGNATIWGGVWIDGPGRLNVSGAGNSSGPSNIEYRDISLADINAFGTAGIIQNTWRELSLP